MDEQEYLEYYNAIVSILRRLELNWVVEQVEEHVRLGKTESAEVSEIAEPVRATGQALLPGIEVRNNTRVIRRERFRITTRYTPKEQLILLMDAVDQVLNSTLMARDILNFFSDEYKIQRIMFHVDSDGGDDDTVNLNFDVVSRISDQVSTAKHLIEDLRRIVNAH